MRNKLYLILICFLLFISNVNAATYKKICTDYTYDKCPDGNVDERGNTCKAAGSKCYISTIKTTCSNVVATSCSEADGHCCGVDSAGNSCTYDISSKKCQNVATYSRKAACSDWPEEDCPKYSDNGTSCTPSNGLCQPTTSVKNSNSDTQTESSDDSSITSDGKIKAITCTGNTDDQIPISVPTFVRTLYNVLKVLVPLIIIFLGIFDFTKAVTSSNVADMDKQRGKFIRRLLAGVAVFFVLAISQWVFGLVGEKDNIIGCVSCFLTTEEDCQEAGYINPAKTDDKGSTPNKTPPISTNKVSQENAYNSELVKKILAEAKKVTTYVRKHGYSYGDSPLNPAMYHTGITSCDRCVGWVLYNLGFKDQPKVQGLTVRSANPKQDLATWLKNHGFIKIKSIYDTKAGDIIFQRPNGSTSHNASHVFILGNPLSKKGYWQRYDCGLQERIDSKQPLTYNYYGEKARFLFAYRMTKLPNK